MREARREKAGRAGDELSQRFSRELLCSHLLSGFVLAPLKLREKVRWVLRWQVGKTVRNGSDGNLEERRGKETKRDSIYNHKIESRRRRDRTLARSETLTSLFANQGSRFA